MDQFDLESRAVTSTVNSTTPKKLARQLDFTPPVYKVPPASSVVLPNHPQAKLQLKIEAKVKPKPQPQLPPQLQHQTPPSPQLQPQPQPQQVQVVRSIVRPPEVQTRTPHSVPVFPRALSHPVPRQPLPAVLFESKEMQPSIRTEAKDTTPKKQKQCNCKNSKCLKLYCECFAAGVYCDGCNCSNCHNNIQHESARQGAVTAALDRNPNAFRPKIANSPHIPRNGRVETGDSAIAAKHNKGCHCKKSGCLKKYCECFQGNIPCSENCRCVDCKNCEGSEERRSLCYGDSVTPTIYYQPRAGNVVVKEALGPYGYKITQVSKKRKNPEHTVVNFHPIQQNTQFPQRVEYATEFHKQKNELKPSALSSPASAVTLGSSKIAFRSLMADIIQPQFIKDLCSDMVVASAEVVKSHIEHIGKVVADVDHKPMLTTQQSDTNTRDCNGEASVRAENSVSNQADGESTSDIGSTSVEFQNERPMSPGMLALMCDENDTSFTLETEKGRQGNEKASNVNSELHVKQEKMILTKFRDFLNHLIVCASVKESTHKNGKALQERALHAIMTTNNSTVRPQLVTSNHSTSNGIRPQVQTSNGISIRPQLPISNHSTSNGFLTPKFRTSASSAANTSTMPSMNNKHIFHPQAQHSETSTSREERSLNQ